MKVKLSPCSKSMFFIYQFGARHTLKLLEKFLIRLGTLLTPFWFIITSYKPNLEALTHYNQNCKIAVIVHAHCNLSLQQLCFFNTIYTCGIMYMDTKFCRKLFQFQLYNNLFDISDQFESYSTTHLK